MRKSSDKIKRNAKYIIYRMRTQGVFAVIDIEQTIVLTLARTHDKAAKHIMSSTGKWPRCAHDWKPCKKVWVLGEEDSFRCEVCGQWKKNRRFLKRSVKGHSNNKRPYGFAKPSNVRKHN